MTTDDATPQPPSMATPTPARSRGKTYLLLACTSLLAAAALGWFAAGASRDYLGGLGATFGDLLASPGHAVPGEFVEELTEDTYLVAVRTSSSTSTGPVTRTEQLDVDVNDLTIVGPSGESIELRDGKRNSVERNGVGYTGVAIFDARRSGLYEFAIDTSVDTDAIVVRSLDAPGRRAVIDMVAWTLSILLAFAGLVLLLAAGAAFVPERPR